MSPRDMLRCKRVAEKPRAAWRDARAIGNAATRSSALWSPASSEALPGSLAEQAKQVTAWGSPET
jgi:hypothetical protein